MNPSIFSLVLQHFAGLFQRSTLDARALVAPRKRRRLFYEALEYRWLMAVGDLRIVNYNVLGYDGTPSTDLGTVLKAIGDETYAGRSRPIDVLAIQEVQSQATTTQSVVNQLNALYGAGTYARGSLNGTSTAGNQTVGLIYNTQTVSLVSEVGVGTVSGSGAARQPIRYQLRPLGLPAGNDFYVYNSHYKATGQGTEAADAARRTVEAQMIRQNADALGQGAHIIYTGDYNVKSSTEASFQAILGVGNGQGFDPANRLGSWSGNSTFRDVFTQAPAINPPAGFVGGGLNDRFDFQLLTGEWTDGIGLEYTAGSYRTFANNGTVSLNGNINSTSNTALASLPNRTAILNLLTTVTDHLPVVVDYKFVDQSLNMTLLPTSISENGGTSQATITRLGSTSSALTVNLTSSNTAAATVPASVTIPAGATSVTVTINAVNDSIADGTQLTTLTATSSGYVSGSATLSVTDDEVASLSLTLNPTSISERDNSTATVVRNTPTTSSLTVNLTSSDITAATVPATVVIPAGATSATFVVTPVDDSVADGNQSTTISVSASGLAGDSEGIVVVDDETAKLTFVIQQSSLAENGGSTNATIIRNTPTTSALSVSISNDLPADLAVPATLSIPAGSTFVNFVISTNDNNVAEGNRQATLAASANGLLADSVQVVIVDNETAGLLLTLNQSSISENGGTTTGTVRRNTPNTQALVVNLSSSDTSAATVPLSVTIPAGSDTATFTIEAVDDSIADGNQVSNISASADSFASIAVPLTVTDDEIAKLILTLVTSTIPENGGSTTATLRRNTPTTNSQQVDLQSSDVTAATVPPFVIIPAGSDTVTFEVTAVDDSVADGTQTTTIVALANGILAPSNQVLTVTDNETAALNFTVQTSLLAENGATTTGTVRRNTPKNVALVVSLVSDDTTEVTVPATVTIPAGADSVDFTIQPVDDLIVDGIQSVNISASSAGLQPSSQLVLVSDDDVPTLTLSLVLNSISENGGTTKGTLHRNTLTTNSLTITLESSEVTAATVPSSVVIPAGAVTVEFVVTGVEDSVADGNQQTTISARAGSLIATPVALTVEDDEVATLSLTIDKTSISEKAGTAIGTVRRNTPTTADLVVSLSSDDTTEATVPSSVTILAGSNTATFTITGVPDGIVDGTQTVLIGATFIGLQSGSASLSVLDEDVWSWTNPVNPLDTDDDKSVSPLDVLALINELNLVGARPLPPPTSRPEIFFDVDSDKSLSPLDVLVIINYLNTVGAPGGGEGEASLFLAAEMPQDRLLSITDEFFADWETPSRWTKKRVR